MARLRQRTRLIIFLPSNDAVEAAVVNQVVDTFRTKFGGATQSPPEPSSFIGFYRDDTANQWVMDEIVMLIVDADVRIDDPLLEQYLSDKKDEIKQLYTQKERPQQDVWITAHPLWVMES